MHLSQKKQLHAQLIAWAHWCCEAWITQQGKQCTVSSCTGISYHALMSTASDDGQITEAGNMLGKIGKRNCYTTEKVSNKIEQQTHRPLTSMVEALDVLKVSPLWANEIWLEGRSHGTWNKKLPSRHCYNTPGNFFCCCYLYFFFYESHR